MKKLTVQFFCVLALLCLEVSTLQAAPENRTRELSQPSNLEEELKVYQFLRADDLNLTSYRFRAYIKPQLRSINSEFYHILRRIRPELDELITLKEKTARFREKWARWSSTCQSLKTEKCHNQLKNLYKRIRQIDDHILKMQGDILSMESQLKGPYFLMKTLDEMMVFNFRIMHFMEQGLMLGQTSLFLPQKFDRDMEQLVHKLSIRSEMILTSLLPKDHKQLFESFWQNFMNPVEKYVLGKNNSKYLIDHLEQLNAEFNLFHMKIEKGQKALPSAEKKVAEVMHNRWNTILKVLMRDI